MVAIYRRSKRKRVKSKTTAKDTIDPKTDLKPFLAPVMAVPSSDLASSRNSKSEVCQFNSWDL